MVSSRQLLSTVLYTVCRSGFCYFGDVRRRRVETTDMSDRDWLEKQSYTDINKMKTIVYYTAYKWW